MNVLPDCIVVMKNEDGIYVFLNEISDYEESLEQYIQQMRHISIPILFTKKQVLELVQAKRQIYYDTVNHFGITKSQRETGEFIEVCQEDGRAFQFQFVLRLE